MPPPRWKVLRPAALRSSRGPFRGSAACVSIRDVVVEPLPGAQPEAPVAHSSQFSLEDQQTQVLHRVWTLRSERSKRDQLRGSREVGNQETSQHAADGSSYHLRERIWVALVRELQRTQIPRALPFDDDRGWVASLDEHEVQHQTTDTPIPIDERVDALQPCMMHGSVDDRVTLTKRAGRCTPGIEIRRNGGGHRDLDGADGDGRLPPGSRLVTGRGGLQSPREGYRKLVHLRDDADRNAIIVRRMPVDPVCRVGIAFNLQVLDQGCRRLAALDQVFDLDPRHSVALNSRGVVDIVDPDRAQDVVRLDGVGKTAEPALQEGDLLIEEAQNVLKRWPSAATLFTNMRRHLNMTLAKIDLAGYSFANVRRSAKQKLVKRPFQASASR